MNISFANEFFAFQNILFLFSFVKSRIQFILQRMCRGGTHSEMFVSELFINFQPDCGSESENKEREKEEANKKK